MAYAIPRTGWFKPKDRINVEEMYAIMLVEMEFRDRHNTSGNREKFFRGMKNHWVHSSSSSAIVLDIIAETIRMERQMTKDQKRVKNARKNNQRADKKTWETARPATPAHVRTRNGSPGSLG